VSLVIFILTSVGVAVWIPAEPKPVPHVVLPLANVHLSIRPLVRPMAVSLTLGVLPIVYYAVAVGVDTLAMLFPIFYLPFVLVAVFVGLHSIYSLPFSELPLENLVTLSLRVDQPPMTMSAPHVELPRVEVTIGICLCTDQEGFFYCVKLGV